MGVDTKGKIKGFVSADAITNYIKEHYDINVSNGVKKEDSEYLRKYAVAFYDKDCECKEYVGYICFKDVNGDDRMLFYLYSTYNTYENLDYYQGLEDEYPGVSETVTTETTYLSLGKWGNSIDIMKDIVSHFGGGWVDEDDCDSVPYRPVENKSNDYIPIMSPYT